MTSLSPFDSLASQEHMTALILAAHHGDLPQVRELINKHNDVNFVDEVLNACMRTIFYFPPVSRTI